MVHPISDGSVRDAAGAQSSGTATPTAAVSPTPVQFSGTDKDDEADGSEEPDFLAGAAGNDTLRGWGGGDYLFGEAGNDRLFGGDGDDTLYGAAGDDLLDGGAGNDSLEDTGGSNQLLGGAGDDVLALGYEATGLLDGGAGNDTLFGSAGGEFRGGEGDDRIRAYAGGSGMVTVIDGGIGADTIAISLGAAQGQVRASGGEGIDTFEMTMGLAPGATGLATVTDFSADAGGDRIDVAGLLPFEWDGANPFVAKQLRLLAEGSDTLLQAIPLNGSAFATALVIKGVLPEQLVASNFVGGYDPHKGPDPLVLVGTAAGDRLEGEDLDDSLSGMGGNDELTGGGGNDILDGGDGDDMLADTAGNNRLLGGAGNDKLSSGVWNWTGSSQVVTSTSVLDGGDGHDRLESWEAGDSLLGGAGNDTLVVQWTYYNGTAPIVLSGGDGDDRLEINPSHIDQSRPVIVTASGGAGADTFVLKDIAPGLAITDLGNEDRIDLGFVRMRSWEAGNPFGALGYLSARAEDGGTAIYLDRDGAAGKDADMVLAFRIAGLAPAALGQHHFVAHYSPDGSSKGIVLTGSAGSDTLAGTQMDDTIGAGEGADTIDGLEGDDLIHGGADNDRIRGGHGRDLLHGEAGNDQLDGGAGDDKLYGGDGNDFLEDAVGANLLDGGAGDDIIRTAAYGTVEGGDGKDTLEIGPFADRVGGGLGDDRITLQLGSTERSDTAMLVDAGAGKDSILIVGDARAVTVTGGAGSDDYRFDGTLPQLVTITDFEAGAGGDVFDLFSLLPPTASGSPLAPGGGMRLVQEGSRVLLQHDADGAAGPLAFVTRVVFEQSTLSAFTSDNFTEGLRPDGSTTGLTLRGSAARDEMLGFRLDDTLYGGDGNDVMLGYGGNDTLHGEAGNDDLMGYLGDDLLLGEAGNDWLFGQMGNDRLVGGAGIDTAAMSGPRAGYAIARTANGVRTTDGRTEWGDGTDELEGVERIVFGDRSALALDIDGGAGQAYRLYRAAFDRTPDAGGLGFWIAAIDAGVSLYDIAAGFAASAEFLDLYGADPGNDVLVSRLYQNILHRLPEQAGFDFWVQALDKGIATLPQVLAMFSESAENREAVAELIANGIAYQPY